MFLLQPALGTALGIARSVPSCRTGRKENLLTRVRAEDVSRALRGTGLVGEEGARLVVASGTAEILKH